MAGQSAEELLARFRQALLPVEDEDRDAWPGMRPAAVLIPVRADESGSRLLFIRRPDHMREHKGQIAFPGGRLDAGETPAAAAVREAHEELGLDPAACRLLGRLPGMPTVTGYWLHPVVAWLESEPELVANPGEVDEYFWADLETLKRPGIYSGSPIFFRGHHETVDYFHYPHPELGERIIWGATGRVLRQLLGQVFDWRPVAG